LFIGQSVNATHDPVAARVQKLQDIFERIASQPIFALTPAQADFLSFQPDSALTPAALPATPWTLDQLKNCLAVHTGHVGAYIGLLSLEAANICTRPEVLRVFGLSDEAADDLAASASDATMPSQLAAILLRASFNLKCNLCAMLFASAAAFAAHLERFVRQPRERMLSRGSDMEVRSLAVYHSR
jgi:hypothetical protein